MTRPMASLSLDLDNKWAYLRAAGRRDWQQARSYLPSAAERIVSVIGEFDLPLTVFAVGRDLVDSADCDALRSFKLLRRWEPANHSLNHLPWMHHLKPEEIVREVDGAAHRIELVTGRRPLGFRAPGFHCPNTLLDVLVRLGYRYDASVRPTSIARLPWMLFPFKTTRRRKPPEQPRELDGRIDSLLRPNRPYRRETDKGSIWEFPVTVMPWTRLPIHISYVTYLAGFSRRLAKKYLDAAFSLCSVTRTSPSLLLRTLDFLGCEDDSEWRSVPGMNQSRHAKLSMVRWALHRFSERFDVHCLIDQLNSFEPSPATEDAADKSPKLGSNLIHHARLSDQVLVESARGPAIGES